MDQEVSAEEKSLTSVPNYGIELAMAWHYFELCTDWGVNNF